MESLLAFETKAQTVEGRGGEEKSSLHYMFCDPPDLRYDYYEYAARCRRDREKKGEYNNKWDLA